MLDIIIFAIIAIFLFIKLKGIIGKEDDSSAKVINKYAISKSIKNITGSVKDVDTSEAKKAEKKLEIEEAIKTNLALINPSFHNDYKTLSASVQVGYFDVKTFLTGIENLFVELIKAKNERNLSAFSNELSPELFKTISSFIEEEKLNNPNQKTDLVKIESITIEDLKAKQSGEAILKIKIASEQIKYSMENGVLTSGSITIPVKFEDYFTLERSFKNKSFVWIITSIE